MPGQIIYRLGDAHKWKLVAHPTRPYLQRISKHVNKKYPRVLTSLEGLYNVDKHCQSAQRNEHPGKRERPRTGIFVSSAIPVAAARAAGSAGAGRFGGGLGWSNGPRRDDAGAAVDVEDWAGRHRKRRREGRGWDQVGGPGVGCRDLQREMRLVVGSHDDIFKTLMLTDGLPEPVGDASFSLQFPCTLGTASDPLPATTMSLLPQSAAWAM